MSLLGLKRDSLNNDRDPHYLEVVPEGQGDTPGDLVGEGQPVLGVDEVNEVPGGPHVLGVTQGGGDGGRRAHHPAVVEGHGRAKAVPTLGHLNTYEQNIL